MIDPSETGSQDAGISHVFADLIYRLVDLQQNPVDIIGDGEQVRSFVHLREIGEAIAKYSFDDRTLNQTYNLGRDEVVTMKDLARRIYDKARARQLIKNSQELSFRSLPAPLTDVKRRVGSFANAERELGWKSAISLDVALDECLARVESVATQHGTRLAAQPEKSQSLSDGQ